MLALLSGAIAFCGTKLLYRQDKDRKITVALVIEDDAPLMEFALSYLESSESVHTFCELVRVSRKEAEQMLDEHTASASMYFPEHFSESLVNGDNTPATITFSRESGIELLLFEALANAASEILSSAQAGIYTIDDLYKEFDFQKKKGTMYDDLNDYTLRTALIRSHYFQVETISSTKELSTKDFYVISGLVLLFLLCGMSLGSFTQPEAPALDDMLSLHGIRPMARTLLKALSLVVLFSLLFALIIAAAALGGLVPWDFLALVPLCAYVTAAWTLFVYHLAASETSGTLFMFLTVLAATFCSGCLLPASFLPKALTTFGRHLPAYELHRLFAAVLNRTAHIKDSIPLLCHACVLLAGSCMADYIRLHPANRIRRRSVRRNS